MSARSAQRRGRSAAIMRRTVRRKLKFPMPASVDVVFDAFHTNHWRARWDTLVRAAPAGASEEYPVVGEVRNCPGKGVLRFLAVPTRCISFDRPKVVAATMEGQAFPFSKWAASMRHRSAEDGRSVMIYTYSLEVRPAWLSPVIAWVFERQTRRRFAALRAFLMRHGHEVVAWQRQQEESSAHR